MLGNPSKIAVHVDIFDELKINLYIYYSTQRWNTENFVYLLQNVLIICENFIPQG